MEKTFIKVFFFISQWHFILQHFFLTLNLTLFSVFVTWTKICSTKHPICLRITDSSRSYKNIIVHQISTSFFGLVCKEVSRTVGQEGCLNRKGNCKVPFPVSQIFIQNYKTPDLVERPLYTKFQFDTLFV